MATRSLEIELKGLDLFDESIQEELETNFSDVGFGVSDKIVTATILVEDDNYVSATRDFVERALNSKLGITAFRWHPDYVGYSEIALRAGLTAEAIRLFSKGERGARLTHFPDPHGYVGTGKHRSPFWTWGEISGWLQENKKVETDFLYPTAQEASLINSLLAHAFEYQDRAGGIRL